MDCHRKQRGRLEAADGKYTAPFQSAAHLILIRCELLFGRNTGDPNRDATTMHPLVLTQLSDVLNSSKTCLRAN